jgi:hypothetical protein
MNELIAGILICAIVFGIAYLILLGRRFKDEKTVDIHRKNKSGR